MYLWTKYGNLAALYWNLKNVNNRMAEISFIGDSRLDEVISQKLCYNSVPKEIEVFSEILRYG